jgi:hypothetical protein
LTAIEAVQVWCHDLAEEVPGQDPQGARLGRPARGGLITVIILATGISDANGLARLPIQEGCLLAGWIPFEWREVRQDPVRNLSPVWDRQCDGPAGCCELGSWRVRWSPTLRDSEAEL